MTGVWEPYAIAVFAGLLTSAALYFALVWPQREPPDDDDREDPAG